MKCACACVRLLCPLRVCVCVSTMVVCWLLVTIRVISCLELSVSFLFFANFLMRKKHSDTVKWCLELIFFCVVGSLLAMSFTSCQEPNS